MKKLSSLAVMAAVATAVSAGSALAANEKPATEKCYGIAKAGKNDCHGGGAAACAGSASKDGQGFLLVPQGLCERIAGGSLTEPDAKK